MTLLEAVRIYEECKDTGFKCKTCPLFGNEINYCDMLGNLEELLEHVASEATIPRNTQFKKEVAAGIKSS